MSSQEQENKAVTLDKFKRRMIRTVARLYKEGKAEDEVWQLLEKEIGEKQKSLAMLWERMRVLTMKKLNRLLQVCDRIEEVPHVARMSLTDWLLVDLIIVHEKIDLIDRENISSKNIAKLVTNLINLVQMFKLEDCADSDLADAWISATLYYNSRGHQVSPMLLQRRWYQVKELTRSKFYNFWFNYRGNQRQLNAAKPYAPSPIEIAVAVKFPHIITQSFTDWLAGIEQNKIIMPEEFEQKMRERKTMKPIDNPTIPDIEIIEQHIETIDLDQFEESENNDSNDANDVPIRIKTEPVDIQENREETRDFDKEIERLQIAEMEILNDSAKDFNETQDLDDNVTETAVTEATQEIVDEIQDDENTELKNVSDDSDIEMVIQDTNKNIDLTEKERNVNESNSKLDSIEIDDNDVICTQDNVNVNDNVNVPDIETTVIKVENPEILTNTSDIAMPVITSVTGGVVDLDNEEKESKNSTDKAVPKSAIEITNAVDRIEPITIKDDIETETGIVKEDIKENKDIDSDDEDLIKIQPNYCDNSMGFINTETGFVKENKDIGLEEDLIKIQPNFCDNSMGFNFISDGLEFVDDGIAYVEEDSDGELENDETSQAQEENKIEDNTPKIDMKLLMCPVVYTTKIDDLKIYKNIPNNSTVKGDEIINIISQNKPVHKLDYKNELPNKTDSDDLNISIESIHSVTDTEINETNKVKLTSYLLNKPKTRVYHPIQLCKNPDFNTRLKRLSVGFFTSARNRILLRECKPLTIDLSKAFESKLINGTMYLKPNHDVDSKEALNKQVIPIESVTENISVATTTIVPSAVPVTSLMEVDQILQEELNKRTIERNKVISLPDIREVRRINQNLLTAQVPPMRVDGNASEVIEQGLPVDKVPETVINNRRDAADVRLRVVNERINTISNLLRANNKMKTNLPQPKPKKKIQRAYAPSWVTKQYAPAQGTDCYLTTDTIYKIIGVLQSECGIVPPTFLKNHLQEFNLKSKNDLVKNKPLKEAPPKQKPPPKPPKPKPPPKPIARKYCCWAKSKLEILKSDIKRRHRLKHQCPKICECCCRHELADFHKFNVKVKPAAKQKRDASTDTGEFVISTDDEEKTDELQATDGLFMDISKDSVYNNIPIFQFDNATQVNLPNESTIQIDSVHKCNNDTNVIACDEDTDVACQVIDNDETIPVNPVITIPPQTLEHQHDEPIVSNQQNIISKNQDNNRSKIVLRYRNNDHKRSFYKVPAALPQKESPKISVISKIVPLSANSKEPETPVNKKIPAPEINKRTIVIDGSRNRIVNKLTGNIIKAPPSQNQKAQKSLKAVNVVPTNTQKTSTRNKLLYIDRERNKSNCPIFIGKGKLLMTDVRLPLDLNEANKPVSDVQLPLDLNEAVPADPTPIMPADAPPVVPVDLTQDTPADPTPGLPADSTSVDLTHDTPADPTPGLPADPTSVDLTHDSPADPTPVLQPPEGVQIILLPDGTLTYSVDPKVVDMSSLSIMPQILTAVQKHMNANIQFPLVPQTNEVINLDSVPDVGETSQNDVTVPDSDVNVQSNDETQKDSSTDTNCQAAAISDLASSRPDPTEENTKQINMEDTKTSDEVDVPVEKSDQQKETEENTSMNRKSLLSDLMQMSGISEDDIAPTVEPEQPIITPVCPITIRLPSLSPKRMFKEPLDKFAYPGLYSIKSYAELKYAYNRNGKFYKLDVKTGVVTTIKVCIKKSNNTAPVPPLKTAFIDLTDEPENRKKPETPEGREPEKLHQTQKPQTPSSSKSHEPVYRRRPLEPVRKPPLEPVRKRPMELVRKKQSQAIDVTKPFIITKHRYRPNLLKKNKFMMIKSKLNRLTRLSKSDSSDDEPLIKKSKGRIDNDLESQAVDDDLNSMESGDVTSGIQESSDGDLKTAEKEQELLRDCIFNSDDDCDDVNLQIDDCDEPSASYMEVDEPRPTQLLTTSNIHNVLSISHLNPDIDDDDGDGDDDDDDDQGDCILGV